jgi:5-methylthioadenosine/S-adenosylhomocysteine deaminase
MQHVLNSRPSEGEFILKNATVLNRYDSKPLRQNIWIRNGQIKALPTDQEVHSLTPNFKSYDASQYFVMPPLWNAHTHCALNFFRGLGDAPPSPAGLSMIETVLFPAEKNLTPDLIAPLAYAHLLEGLQSGVVGIFDHYYFVEGIGDALTRLGMRGAIGETTADLGGALPGMSSWERARKSIENWRFGSQISPMLAPHAADTVSRRLLTEVATYARTHKLPLHMHLSQTDGESQRVMSRENQTPVEYAEQCGAIAENSLLVHLVTASPSDLQVIARNSATIGFCPTSQVLYERLSPIEEFVRQKIKLVLGTDCAASNDSGNLLQEQKFAALSSRMRNVPQTPQEILKWTTWNAVQLLSNRNELGEIAAGKSADMIMIAKDLQFWPNEDFFVNHLIFSAESRNIRHVMVAGEFILWEGEPTRVSRSELADEHKLACQRILQRIGRS